MHIANLPTEFTIGFEVGAVGLCGWFGGSRDRAMAAALAWNLVNGQGHLAPSLLGGWDDVIAVLVGAACLAGGGSYWIIWSTAGMLLSVVGDIAYRVHPQMGLWGFWSAELVFWYFSMLMVVCGAVLHRPPPEFARVQLA